MKPAITLIDWCVIAHDNSRFHGFHDAPDDGKPSRIPERQALLHSEVTELFESFRKDPNAPCGKEGLALSAAAEELADIVIRLFDFIGEFKIDPIGVFAHATFASTRASCILDDGYSLGEEICIMHDTIALLRRFPSDAAARLFMQCVHFAKRYHYDLELAVSEKHRYNINRPHMHGKRF